MRTVPLKRLCVGQAQYGLNIAAEQYRSDGCRLIRTTDVQSTGELIDSELGVYVDDDAVAEHHRLRAGDVLFSRSGTLGRCLLATQEMSGMTFAGFLVRFRPHDQSDPRFISYFAGSLPFAAAIEADAVSSTISNFNAERYSMMSVPEWGLREQRAIADFLDAETARIDSLVRARTTQAGLAHERFETERIFATLQSDAGPLALRRLFSVVGGSWGSEPGTGDVDLQVIRAADFTYTKLCTADDPPLRSFAFTEAASKLLFRGDLVLEKSGGGENQPVGRVVRYESSMRALPSNFAARLRPHERGSDGYLSHALAALWYSGKTRAVIKQTTGIQNLDLDAWLSLQIPWPEQPKRLALAGRLHQRMSAVNSLSASLQRSIALLQERKQALITAAVTGQLDLARDIAEEAS